MIQEIKSKTELESMTEKLQSEVIQLSSDITTLSSKLNGISNYDGINVSGAASTLKSNLANLSSDLEAISGSIKLYVSNLNSFDVDDFATMDVASEINTMHLNTSAQPMMYTNAPYSSPSSSYSRPIASTMTYSSPSYSGNSSAGNSSNNSSSVERPFVPLGTPATNNPTTEKIDITEPTTITTTGKTSSNGLTQQSAKTNFVIKPGDPENPDVDVTKYHNNESNGFIVTTGNLSYELCEEDIDLLCAIVSAESDKSYDDALAVISTILNRCETSNWVASHGQDPIAQATAPNQYVVYQEGHYKRFINGNAPETVKQAVKDALNGVRNHEYCSFRSNDSVSYSNNMITSTGNRYK